MAADVAGAADRQGSRLKLPLKKRAAPAAPDRGQVRREFLALRPFRNPDVGWEETDGRVTLTVKRGTDWKVKLVNMLFPVPAEKRIVLDAIGSDVWRLCDGHINMDGIARRIGAQYQVGARQAELSLQQFFKDLGRRGYVAFVTDVAPGTQKSKGS